MANYTPFTPEQLASAQSYYGVPAPSGPAPGDPGFAASILGAPPPPAPVATPAGPAPGDPGFGLAQVMALPPPTPAAPPPGMPVISAPGAAEAIQANNASIAQARKPLVAGIPTITMDLPAQAPAALSPTARDDAEFAAYKRLLETRKAPAASGKGGAPANPDPFGVKAAQAKVLGTFDEERDAVKAGAKAEGDRAALVARERQALAAQQQEDAALHAREVEHAQKSFDEQMGEVGRQLDAVRSQKIDPSRLMHGDGMGVLAVVGGLLGGMYQGLNKLQSNPFLDDLNQQIDRDIAAQEKNIDAAHRDVSDRMNLLREQRATFKDNDLAKLQTRQLMYEATKQSIEAKAAEFDDPIKQAQAAQAVSAIDRSQATLEKDIKERAQAVAQQQAAAAAAQTRAQQAEMRSTFKDTYEKALAQGMDPAKAEAEAARMVQNTFAGGAPAREASPTGAAVDPVAASPKDQRAAAQKELEEHSKAEAGVRAIEKSFALYAKTGFTSPRQLDAFKSNIGGAYKAGLGPGVSSENDFKFFIEPNLPSPTDTNETLAVKREAIVSSLRSKIATPTLDRYAPGWRGPAPVQTFGLDGKPKG